MKITLTDPRTSVTLQPRNFTVTLSGARGPAGQGLPAGGAEGQIIVKQSATDYDTAWADNYATNVELYVKNSSGSAMTKGQVVYVSGADGNNPTITLSIATTEMGSSKTIGVLKQDLADGEHGYVVTDGLLEGLNTNAATAVGDTIWLSPTTAGGVVYGTANKPSAPNHMVFIGYVIRKNTNNGKIFVKVQNGFELQELHNVAISSPVTGQVLKYNATTGLWSNDTDTGGINTLNGLTTSSQSFAIGTSGADFGIVSATGTHTFNLPTASASARGLLSSTDWSTFNGKQSALSFDSTPTNGSTNPVTSDGVFDALALKQDVLTNPVTGTGTSGQVSYWTGTGTQGGSANLFWDAVNSRLGILRNAPIVALDVNSSADTAITGLSAVPNNATALIVGNNLSNAILACGSSNTQQIWLQGRSRLGNGSSYNLYLNPLGSNVYIGTSSDLSARLGIRGSGTTSSTTALLVQNGTPSSLLTITDDGNVTVNSGTFFAATIEARSSALTYRSAGFTNANQHLFTTSASQTITSGDTFLISSQSIFSPTSGTATYSNTWVRPTINQTGGANGITRGLYVNPTLTAAADWRAIEWSNNTGWGLYGAGSANNYLAGSLGIGTTGLTANKIRIGGTVTGATSAFGVQNAITFLSDVTTTGHGYTTGLGTQATAFNMNFMYHYRAQLSGIGAGSTIGTQVGFVADGTIVGATNNYGFQGSISAGTGKWNIYMDGTAANYLAGDTAIGTTTTSGGRLTVRGSTTTSAANSLLVEDSAGTDTFVLRNDGGYAFKGGTVGLAQTGYTTFTNLTTDRTCDANATTVEELADILGTLIEDLKIKGIISA